MPLSDSVVLVTMRSPALGEGSGADVQAVSAASAAHAARMHPVAPRRLLMAMIVAVTPLDLECAPEKRLGS